MKNSIYLLAGVLLFFACKKESNNSTPNTVTNSTNTITCIDNPNINFTSIGTPIGKFGECIKDIDGNVYKTVTIGSQTWMAENLKVSKYNDGTSIPNITDSLDWTKLTTGAWCNYNNSDSLGKIYGKLYNWFTVSPSTNGNKNVCPTDWHIPSKIEWNLLTDGLGGLSVAGGKMKEIGNRNWKTTNSEVTNTAFFNGIPSGIRDYYNGTYGNSNLNCYWWSSTESKITDAWFLYLDNKSSLAYISSDDKPLGISVRCIKDQKY